MGPAGDRRRVSDWLSDVWPPVNDSRARPAMMVESLVTAVSIVRVFGVQWNDPTPESDTSFVWADTF